MATNAHESEIDSDVVAESVIGAAFEEDAQNGSRPRHRCGKFLDLLASRDSALCAHEVSNVLGAGFLEKVYERALARELTPRGLRVSCQVSFPVSYKGQLVGEYLADLVVEGRLVIELKCVERFSNEHMAQCINYLKASHLRLALLFNFQKPKVEWKRIVVRHSRMAPKAASDGAGSIGLERLRRGIIVKSGVCPSLRVRESLAVRFDEENVL
jgi:GxxExxY protein